MASQPLLEATCLPQGLAGASRAHSPAPRRGRGERRTQPASGKVLLGKPVLTQAARSPVYFVSFPTSASAELGGDTEALWTSAAIHRGLWLLICKMGLGLPTHHGL